MMQKIQVENFNKVIKDQEGYNFTVDADGVYLIVLSARCKNWLQNFRRLFNDDDLALQVDDYLFAEIKGKKREFSNAGSWNGNELKNKIKDVFIILPLKKGTHAIKFWAGEQPFLEKIEIYKTGTSGGGEINLAKSDFARFDGFRDVMIKNLAVSDLTIKASVAKNNRLELKIDGKTQLNPRYKRYAKWFWYGQELQGGLKEYKMPYCLEGGVHSLEFRAQGRPIIDSISFVIRDQSLRFKVGRVRLYKDITPADIINLRSVAHSKKGNILANLREGDEVEILNDRVAGEYIGDLLSDIWHEVIFNDIRGFVFSSFIEIEGQERGVMIDLIKERCLKYDIDANLMLAIAARESHFKPFAHSSESRKGIFQLGEGAMIDVKINDAYNYYQNVDGGVRYYKLIEKQFIGRGDILRWRLVAWHDGPTVTKKRTSIKDEELSLETRAFLKFVLENCKKKDWLNTYYLPILILLFSSLISGYLFLKPGTEATIDDAWKGTIIPEASDQGTNLKETVSEPESKNFPAVLINNEKNEIKFINSEKNKVAILKIEDLNLNGIFEIPPDLLNSSDINNTYNFEPVLEYPKNIFYFFATNSLMCGANNCTFAFFRFDADDKKLELIDHTLFGGIRKLYLSPNFRRLALFATDHSGATAEDDHIHIFDLSNFKEWEIGDYFDWKFSAHHIDNFLWKDDNEIQFEVYYSRSPDPKAKMTTWLYNIEKGKSREIKSELFDLNLSG